MTTIIFSIVLLIANATSFALMAKDKRAAKKNQWRVKEKTLFIAAACFGGLGGVLGMYLLHHKTRHWYFKIFFPAMLLAQIIILIWVGKTWLTI